MDYAANQKMLDPGSYGVLGAAKQIKPDVPLDRISIAADRVDRLAYTLEAFNERFYSGGGCGSEEACRPVPSGYDGQIARLNDAIDRLENAVQRTQTIG